MAACVYYQTQTTLIKIAGVVPDDCNHVVQTNSEYQARSDTITSLQAQVAAGGGTTTEPIIYPVLDQEDYTFLANHIIMLFVVAFGVYSIKRLIFK